MNSNIKLRLTILLIMGCGLALTSCVHQSKQTLSTGNTTDEKTTILIHPHLDHLKTTLKDIVNDRTNGTDSLQHFYFSRYSNKKNGSAPTVYMLWFEQKLVWIFNPGGEALESWLGLRYPSSGQLINLGSGIGSNKEDVGSSAYLVTEEWAQNVIYQTYVIGDLITIN